jgi:hypothetical protein
VALPPLDPSGARVSAGPGALQLAGPQHAAKLHGGEDGFHTGPRACEGGGPGVLCGPRSPERLCGEVRSGQKFGNSTHEMLAKERGRGGEGEGGRGARARRGWRPRCPLHARVPSLRAPAPRRAGCVCSCRPAGVL